MAITIENVLQAKAFILTLKQRIDNLTRASAIKLTSHEESLLNRAKTVLQQNGQYAEVENGRYLSIVKSRLNGLYMTQWVTIGSSDEAGTSANADAIFAQMLKQVAEAEGLQVESAPGVKTLKLDDIS